MDTAWQCIPMARMRIVTAEDVVLEFQNDLPASVSFCCPSCNQSVYLNRGNIEYAAGAGISRQRTRARSPKRLQGAPRRTVHAHFKHAKNNPVAKLCDRYQASIGAHTPSIPPALPMFLRRNHGTVNRAAAPNTPRTTMFHLELSVRRRSLGCDLIGELRNDHAMLTVDRDSHDLADLVADRRRTIRLEDPAFQLRARISVPERWQRNVGVPEDGERAFVFTAEFGPNGGRRLTAGSSLHAGFDYYAVVRPRELHVLQSCFDIADAVGTVPSSHGDLLVVRIVTLEHSLQCDQANFWLADHGLRLTSLDLDAVPIWPPQLHANGIDEPLFAKGFQIYQTPFATCDDVQISDTIDFPPLHCDLPDPRRAGLLGFTQIGRRCTQIEGACCFLRANGHLPWSAYALSRTYPEGLELADPPDLRPADPPAADDVTMPATPTLRQLQWQRVNRHYDVTQMRAGLPACHGLPSGAAVARIRSAHR